MSAGAEVSVEFQSDGQQVLRGVIHRPEQATPAVGLVFVHPFAEEKKCSHRLDVGIRGEQHPTHIGVLDDGDRGCLGVRHLRPLSALYTLLGKGERCPVRRPGNGRPLQSHLHPRGVHHLEHQPYAPVLLAQ